MNDSLKKRTSIAIFWSFLDKGGQQVIQLIFGIILARILLPSEMGLFALLAIFTSVANILQESGFSSALIRKKEATDKDLCSIFYFNISVSILVYCLFFFAAPIISHIYDEPLLTNLARVVFLSFVFNSFGLIQNVILVKKMDFKTNTKITVLSSSIAGIIAILLAMNGFGIWSLAVQLVIQCLLRSLFLWLFVRWMPKYGFSYGSIKEMSSYSMKLLATSVMNQVCSNLYANIIGKYFSTYQAGVYSQAYKYGILPQSVISEGIRSAAFPALSKIENDMDYTKKAFRKTVRITAFVSFPIALMIIVIAKPLILILITEKWADSIPILQIFAVGAAFYPLYSLVGTLLQVLGKSGLIFRLETCRNIFAIGLIFISIKYGVHGIVAGASLVSFLAFVVGMFIAGKQIKYRIWEIIKDTIPYGIIATICIAPFMFLGHLGVTNLYALAIIPSVVGGILYLLALKVAGAVILDDTIDFFKQLSKKGQLW